MKNWISAGIVTAALAAASTAFAADIARPVYKAPPVVVPVYNWTGFYVGGHVGYGWGADADAFLSSSNAATAAFVGAAIAAGNLPLAYNAGGNGWLGGVQAGFNWQSGVWVVGIEGDYSWTSLGGSINIPGVNAAAFPTNAFQSDINALATVRGRLGVTVTPTVLVYGTGGFAWADINQSILTRAANGDAFFGNNSGTATGWTLGGGVEFAIGNGWSVKGEYLYYHLSPDSFVTSALGGNCSNTTNNCALNVAVSDINVSTVRLGVNYKFDWSKAPVVAKY